MIIWASLHHIPGHREAPILEWLIWQDFPKTVITCTKANGQRKMWLHIFPHWNWSEGDTVDVWAYYNNADEVELFLNGIWLGSKAKTGDKLHVQWRVPFEPGTLKATSRKDGKEVLTKEIKTAGKAATINLAADRSNISADGKDLSFITVDVLDADGNLVPNADNLITFKVEGPGSIAGVDNGDPTSHEPFNANHRKAFNGLSLVIIQSEEKEGTITITASSPGLESQTIELKTTH